MGFSFLVDAQSVPSSERSTSQKTGESGSATNGCCVDRTDSSKSDLGGLQMRFPKSIQLIRKAAFWIIPLGLLSATAANAQWAQPYGYYDDYDHAMRHHERDEKRALKQHQREERWYYGDSWALRQHQREERHELQHHQRHERGYGELKGFYDRRGYSGRDWYDDRRY
jgi:hypothetical protein